MTSRAYHLSNFPTFLRPIVKVIIENSDVYETGFDTDENLQKFAEQIYTTVQQESQRDPDFLTKGDDIE